MASKQSSIWGSAKTDHMLRAEYAYDPETGCVRRAVGKTSSRPDRPLGSLASNGYRRIDLGHRTVAAHRLAWFLHYGVWPERYIDHINGDRTDNRIANLRDVDRSVNGQNRRKAQKNNRFGLLGVTTDRGRYVAQIQLNGSNKHIGAFDTPEEAHAAYLQVKRAIHPGATI